MNHQKLINEVAGLKLKGMRRNNDDTMELLFEKGTILRFEAEHDNFNERNWLSVVRVEEQLGWIVPDTTMMDREIKRIYDDGQGFVSAIKYCSEQTGWGLKESKEYVEKVTGETLK